jgi:penicillin amidase
VRKAWCFAFAVLILSIAARVHAEADDSGRFLRTLGGLESGVEVIIDKNGIPHIYAENEADAMFALGYMHARDRLWQMDFSRRAAEGRLAEILGSAALEHDIFMRTLGINRLARNALERTKQHPAVYENLRAYAWGVNSCIAGMMPENLPLQFERMGYQPGPWRPEDSLAIQKAMAWELCGSFDDLYLAALVEKLGRETVDELFPVDRYNEIPIIPPAGTPGAEARNVGTTVSACVDGEEHHCTQLHSAMMMRDTFRLFGARNAFGSNNWVIDGTKSATGEPILASDPHLGLQLPSVWYAAHITARNLDVTGATMPGLPVVIEGHNRHIAWAVTNTQADVTDFYIEQLNDENTEYLYEGQWKPLKVFTETIQIRGQDSSELEIHETEHGPLVSMEPSYLSIRWTGAEPDDDAYAFYLLNHAADYDDFATAMQVFNTPPMNFAYADTNGMIAMWVAGLFPVRRTGLGRVPADGTSAAFEWTGFVPRIDTPHSVNPSQHYLASANQRPAGKGYPYYLGYEWDPGYRARRINHLLSSHDEITREQMQAFQADTYDTAAAVMVPPLAAACGNDLEEGKLYAQALAILAAWDFNTTTDSPAPTIWWQWLDNLRDVVWEDEWRAAGIEPRTEPWGHAGINKWHPPLEVLERLVVEDPTSKWFDDVSTENRETLRECALKSLRATVNDLRLRLGDDTAEWNWGVVNRLRIDHLSGDPLLGRGGHPLSGSDVAVCARGSGGDVTSGPSWRMVVDFSDLGATVGIFPGGQSGNPLTPHYDDLIDIWARDEYVLLHFYLTAHDFPEEHTETTLTLVPPSAEAEQTTP